MCTAIVASGTPAPTDVGEWVEAHAANALASRAALVSHLESVPVTRVSRPPPPPDSVGVAGDRASESTVEAARVFPSAESSRTLGAAALDAEATLTGSVKAALDAIVGGSRHRIKLAVVGVLLLLVAMATLLRFRPRNAAPISATLPAEAQIERPTATVQVPPPPAAIPSTAPQPSASDSASPVATGKVSRPPIGSRAGAAAPAPPHPAKRPPSDATSGGDVFETRE
jgi:hypothetical protein